VLSIALAAVLLWLSIRGVEWRRVERTIARAELRYLAAALAITLCSYFLRAVRWRILLNAGASLKVATVFWANMAGYLGNSFLPARAGEVIRSLLISSHSPLSRTYVLTTALGERLMDAIALVLWSSVVLMGVDAKPRWMNDLSRTMAVAAGAGALLVMVLPHAGTLVESILGRLPAGPRLRGALLRLAREVLLGLRAFHDWGRFAGFVALTVVVWTCDAWTTMAVARALGLSVSFTVAFLLLTGMGLGSALPSTPGYVGIYQFVAVTVLAPFGIGRDDALAYVLVLQAVGYVLVVACGIPGLHRLRAGERLIPSPGPPEAPPESR